MPRTKLSLEETRRLLEPLKEEICLGLSDKEASLRSGVSVRAVQRWRLSQGIKHTELRGSHQDVTAISSFGESLGDVKQRTTRSSVRGQWKPPTYVTRAHLDYDRFIRVLFAANRLLGLSEDDIVGALGMGAHSVSQGLSILDSVLERDGIRCAGCGSSCLPGYGSYCSKLCEESNAAE